ncbi:MAG: OsmC family protein [Acidobacteriota bacterium]|nr:MAG: OsmC family protein [Acidobacteriota bacterium]
MLMEIVFPGDDRVEAVADGRVIATDQHGAAPSPFELFLASIGTCAGIYVARFCHRRGLPTDQLRIRQRMTMDPATRMIERVELEFDLPDDFPDKYRSAVVRAAEQCAVKKHLARPPEIAITIAEA